MGSFENSVTSKVLLCSFTCRLWCHECWLSFHNFFINKSVGRKTFYIFLVLSVAWVIAVPSGQNSSAFKSILFCCTFVASLDKLAVHMCHIGWDVSMQSEVRLFWRYGKKSRKPSHKSQDMQAQLSEMVLGRHYWSARYGARQPSSGGRAAERGCLLLSPTTILQAVDRVIFLP